MTQIATTAPPAQEPPRRPDRTFTSGPMSLAVWDSEITEADGRKRMQHSCRLEKRFFDDAKQAWRTTPTLFPGDWPHAIFVFLKAALTMNVRTIENDRNVATAPDSDAAPVNDQTSATSAAPTRTDEVPV
jgi:hypothetical protein